MFDVNVLLFGNHSKLARRCLDSIQRTLKPELVAVVRIGLNEIHPMSLSLAQQFALHVPVPVHLYQEKNNRNVWKYPMMRRMLYDAQRPVTASHVMWFDDDSYLDPPPIVGGWWNKVAKIAECQDLVGSAYKLNKGFRPGQHAWIAKQPWFGKKPISPTPKFATGGWWIGKSAVLQKWNYPFPELQNNGGDSLLGELIHQQGLRLHSFRQGVKINFDASRGGESKSVRRGRTTYWPGECGQPADLKHQEFEITVTDYLPRPT